MNPLLILGLLWWATQHKAAASPSDAPRGVTVANLSARWSALYAKRSSLPAEFLSEYNMANTFLTAAGRDPASVDLPSGLMRWSVAANKYERMI